MTDYKQAAQKIRDEIIKNRRTIHGFAETGFDLTNTVAYVEEQLRSYGIEPTRVGKAGISCVIGHGEGKTILLRGDMDALPMQEETGLPFASTNGNCHSCGHDCHTAMMLGAAKLLKQNEDELEGRVKMMFQPAEEILAGATDMIENGILENPKVDAAVGMHIFVGNDASETGTIVYKPGCSTYSGDAIRVNIIGEQAHGSTPQFGVDAITIAAHIIISLQEILAREIGMDDRDVVLVGKIEGGSSCNTMSGTCTLDISTRSDTREGRTFLKQRVKEISESVAATFRGKAEVEYVYGMASLYNDIEVTSKVARYCREILGNDKVIEATQMFGTEDFTAVSEEVPSVYIHLGAGSISQGHTCGLHNPGMIVDEDALPIGVAAYCHIASRYLQENK